MTKVTDQDRKDLSKALGYANWSAVGLFIPFIGWLLAGMSLSFIKTIPITTETSARIMQIKRAAWLGIIVSSFAVAAWGGIYRYNQYQAEKEVASVRAMAEEQTRKEQEAQNDLQMKETRAKNGLNNCLTKANDDYWNYIKINASSQNENPDGRITYYASEYHWSTADGRKKEATTECYRKHEVGLFDNYFLGP